MANEVEIVVTGKDRTGSLFSGIANRFEQTFSKVRQSVSTHLKRSEEDTDRHGKSIGSRLAGSIVGGFKTTSRIITDTMNSVLTGSLKGALSTPIVGPIILAALGTVAAVVAPAAATLIGGALILGIGAGLVGVGALILSENEKVKAGFTKTFAEVKGILADAFKPLIPVLDVVRGVVKGLAQEFAPVIKQGMQIAQGPLKSFVKDLGRAFLELKPAIAPIMTAFGDLLNQIGPMLPGLFKSVAKSLIDLAGTFSENADLFADLFVGLMKAIPLVISLISGLASAFRGSLTVAVNMFDGLLGVIGNVMRVVSKIPGPWQASAAAIANSIQGVRNRIHAWQNQIENFPKEVKLKGEIRDLESKLRTAKAKLNDKDLTRDRKAALKAEIGQLQAAIARAKAALASVRSRTVTLTVNTINRTNGPPMTARASGGIVGAAGGGPRSNMTLVGEQGPELVRLPYGSSVIPAGQTQSMLSNSRGDGVTVNLYVQGSIRSDRDLISLIRDEFMNGGFRGAIRGAVSGS